MEQNERKNMKIVFVEPEAVEDLPLSRAERIKESARNLCRRMKRFRLPGIKTILTAAAALLVLLVLIAAPLLPVIGAVMMALSCFRSAFRAQTA